MVSRRVLLTGGSAVVAGAVLTGFWGGKDKAGANGPSGDEHFQVEHTEQEWRDQLNAEQFNVLRKEGTEQPYTSPLNDEHRKGLFSCAGCERELFSSDTKFDSGTGWPSFWKPLDGAVGTKTDRSLLGARTEVHCSRCGGHLGHVFNDGPKPTGLRYCMNGVAMTFAAA